MILIPLFAVAALLALVMLKGVWLYLWRGAPRVQPDQLRPPATSERAGRWWEKGH